MLFIFISDIIPQYPPTALMFPTIFFLQMQETSSGYFLCLSYRSIHASTQLNHRNTSENLVNLC